MIRRLFSAASAVSLLVMIAACILAGSDSYRFGPRTTWVLGSRRIYVSWHPPTAYVNIVDDPNGDLVPGKLTSNSTAAGQWQWPLRQRSDRFLRAGPFVASYHRWVGTSPAITATETGFGIGYGGVAVAGAFLPLGWMIAAAYRHRRREASRFPVETVGACRVRGPGFVVSEPGRPVC